MYFDIALHYHARIKKQQPETKTTNNPERISKPPNPDVHIQKRGSKLVQTGGEFEKAPCSPPQSHRRWNKGTEEGRNTICKLEAKRRRTNEFRDPTCGQHVQVQTTFTVQLPLLQLTYVRYMKVHNTKQQLQGFPIFRRGAK